MSLVQKHRICSVAWRVAAGVYSVACFHPLKAFRTDAGDVVFVEPARCASAFEIPCGQCVGCRLERSRQWAIRCLHESQMHKDNCFVTLTYSDENLPRGHSLDYRDYQLFMKRARKALGPFRFYMCGEYGESTFRPHYHACLFGINFDDRKYFQKGSDGDRLYKSEMLDRLWSKGNCLLGDVTFKSAAYCARYIMSKITGDNAESHYRSVDLSTGESIQRVPEFNRMSLKPGIGRVFFDKYISDMYPRGYCVVNGKQVKPPKYYDNLYNGIDEVVLEEILLSRAAKVDVLDNTESRLAVRKKVVLAKVDKLKRSME